MTDPTEMPSDISKTGRHISEILLGFLAPRFIRNRADADYYAAERLCDAIDMAERRNVERVVMVAREQLQHCIEAPAEDLDEQQFLRILAAARSISDETLQTFMGLLLAGEVESPGSFSPRTISIVRDLTTPEALTFQNVLSCSLGGPGGRHMIVTDQGLGCDRYLARLVEAQLVSSSSIATELTLQNGHGQRFFAGEVELICVVEGEPVLGRMLTAAGSELAAVVDFTPSQMMLSSLQRKRQFKVVDGGHGEP